MWRFVRIHALVEQVIFENFVMSVTVFLTNTAFAFASVCALVTFCEMAPKGRRNPRRPSTGADAGASSGSAGSAARGALTAAEEAEIERGVLQRLRETFRTSTAEEKDIIISTEGLTMRQTLTRDLRLKAMGSPQSP